MNRTLQRQIERIADSGGGNRRSVIIRLKTDVQEAEMARLAARAIGQRNLCLSARDVLPSERTKTTKTRAPQDQEFPRDNQGLSTYVAKTAASSRSVSMVRKRANSQLDSI